jgi:hypothetical protein
MKESCRYPLLLFYYFQNSCLFFSFFVQIRSMKNSFFNEICSDYRLFHTESLDKVIYA